MNIVINTRKKYHPQDDEYAFGCLLAKRVVFHLQHARDEQDSEDIKNLYRNVYKDLGIEYTPQILEKSVGQLSSNFVRQQINHGSIDKKEYDILEHERNLARVEKDCRLKEEKRFEEERLAIEREKFDKQVKEDKKRFNFFSRKERDTIEDI